MKMPVLAIIVASLIMQLAGSFQLDTTLPSLIRQVFPIVKKEYQVAQSQAFRYSYQPSSKIMNYYQSSCHIHPALITVEHQLSYKLTKEHITKSYSFNKIQKSLYELSPNQITKFSVNWETKQITRLNSLLFSSNCPKTTMQGFEDREMLVFSCEGIYKINSETLDRTEMVSKHEPQFKAFKILRYEELIFQISANQGINVYSVDFQLNIRPLYSLTKFGNHSLHIADMAFSNGILYVLDHKKGVFIFERMEDSFKEKDTFNLELGLSIQYHYLTVNQHNLYIAFQNKGKESVLECSFMFEKLYLVRYFKGYGQIQKIEIFDNKLLIQSSLKIDLVPINRDPRMIDRKNAGYTYNHQHSIQTLYYLQNSQFLIATPGKLEIVNLKITDNVLECQFSDTGSFGMIFQTSCIKDLKAPFYHVCTQLQRVVVNVTPAVKDNYNWLLLISLGLFVIAMVSLIYWREEELIKINKLIRKVKFLKQKLQQKTKPVQFQEVDHAYSDMVYPEEKKARNEKTIELSRVNEEEGQEEVQVGTQRGQLVQEY